MFSHYIRPANKTDFPAIKAIYNLSKLDELANEPITFTLLPLEQDKKRLSQLLESNIYVYEDGEVLGYGALFKNEIRALFVHPNARRKSIGKQILTHLLKDTKDDVSLYVAKSNHLAKKLYQQYGFEIRKEFETTYNNVSVLANKMTRHPSP